MKIDYLLNQELIKNKFNEDGFVILKNLVDLEEIKLIQNYAADFLSADSNPKSLIAAMESLEEKDKKSFYEFSQVMGSIPPLLRIALNKDIFSLVIKLLGVKEIYLEDSSIFFNKESVKRLQYDWHQEKSYFPNVNEVITLWFPWLTNVSKENGTMIMAKGANKEIFNTKKISLKNGLTQMQICDADLDKYEKIHCELNLGDIVIFSSYSPHRTGYNSSGIPRTSILCRFTDKTGKINCGWE